jgi:beta-xylosidase
MKFPNPLIPGFNPDPSVVAVGGVYYLVTSTFEYLPGIPVYRSTNLSEWTHIGNVVSRPEQAGVTDVPTGGGVWAPTIRYRDGVFYVIVTVAMSPRGCVVFTATDPAGPWSDGTTIDGVGGIDPDLAWDDDGTAYVTFSGLYTGGERAGQHLGIQQVRVDLAAGKALEEPRSLWSGTGLKFPEAPHLYQRGGYWYLMIAEGGTERGHSVSVARGHSPEGPFAGCPGNPVLSARSTSRSVQNTGHADLVATADGGDALVLLGMRPLGLTQAFSPLGRETFITPVSWADGWPRPEPVRLAPQDEAVAESFDFADPSSLDDPGWLAVRTTPPAVASITDGRLSITGRCGLDDPHPQFVGRRQRHLTAAVSVIVDASAGAGGLAARYDEDHWFALEARGTAVTARARLAGVEQAWQATLPEGEVELRMEMSPPSFGFTPAALGGDRVRLLAGTTLLAELDGRYWTAETCASFTGRVIGLYASLGTVRFRSWKYRGTDAGTGDHGDAFGYQHPEAGPASMSLGG